MLDILDQYLADSVTPELHTAIERANTVFDRLGLTEQNDQYESILMMDDAVEPGTTATSIFDYTLGILNDILLQHMVKVQHDDTDIIFRCILIEGLLILPAYENPSEILAVAHLDLDSEERFAELISLVTELAPSEITHRMEMVSGSLINKIIDVANRDQRIPDEDEEERAQKAQLLKRLQLYNEFLGKPADLHIVAAVRDHGVPTALDFLVYASLIGRDFEAMEDKEAAQNLVGMAIISHDGCYRPQEIISKYIDHFISDINKVTRVVNVLVRELLLGFQNYEQA